MTLFFCFLAVGIVLCLYLAVTTPTSYYGRLTGTETWPDPITFNGGFTSPASGSIIQGMGQVLVAAATTTLTLTPALHAGKVVLIQSTGGLTITPAPATGTGNTYYVCVITTISGGSLLIDYKLGAAADLIQGTVAIGATTGGVFSSATNSNLVTFNATTTGGIIGTWFSWIDLALNKNVIMDGSVVGSGTAGSPFTNH